MTDNQRLECIPNVIIDSGVFKYIQIRVSSKSSSKIVIRGFVDAEYHADVYDQSGPQIEALGFKTEVIGGGRIKHEDRLKTLNVYGYSVGFGKADHEVTVKILKEKYPEYKISWSDEGY